MATHLRFTAVLFALAASACTAEQQICGRMATLCGTSREVCGQLVKSTHESFGDDGVQGVKACFADAQTCGEASGCVAGKGVKNLGAAAVDFFKGVVKGLDDKQ